MGLAISKVVENTQRDLEETNSRFGQRIVSRAAAPGLPLDWIAFHLLMPSRLLDPKSPLASALLITMCGRSSVDNVKAVLDYGVDVNGRGEGSKKCHEGYPLIQACDSGHEDTIALLLERKADVNAIYGSLHTTALATVVFNRNGYMPEKVSRMIRLLLAHGADINIRDDHNRSPFHEAANKRSTASVQTFLEECDHETLFNLEGYRGWNALMYAVSQGNFEVVQLLVQSGMDLFHKASSGDTAFSLAESLYNTTEPLEEVVSALRARYN